MVKHSIFAVLLFAGLFGCAQKNNHTLNCYNADAKAYHEAVEVGDDEIMRMASYAIYEALKDKAELALLPENPNADTLYDMYNHSEKGLTMGVSRHVLAGYSNVFITYKSEKISDANSQGRREGFVSFVVVYTDCGEINVRY